MSPDARELSERELLLLVYDDVQEMKRDLLGVGGAKGFIDETRDRLKAVETRMDYPKTQAYGIPAVVSASLLLIWEAVKQKTGMG